MSLFPNKPSGAENAMVYFRCGVVNTTKQADGSFKCKADKRKGLLTLERGADVRFFYFLKRERESRDFSFFSFNSVIQFIIIIRIIVLENFDGES